MPRANGKGRRPRDATTADVLAILALGLAVRVPLVLAYPAIHGGDSIARLARSDTLVLGLWLPLPQALVFLTRAVAPDPLWTRLVFGLVGALVPVALAALMAATAGPLAGRAAGALLALHPLFVYYSIVPYQESLMTLLLLLGALALVRGRDALAGLAFGLACLCRYEAWIAAALAASSRRRAPLRALGLFGWAPILWMLLWGGLSPAGTYALDLDPAAGRWSRLAFLFAKLREYSGAPLPLLAVAGGLAAFRRRDRRWAWGGAFVVLFLAAQLVVGQEDPPGSGHVNERTAHLPAAALCALAGLALEALEASAGRRRAAGTLVAAAAVVWIGLGWARRSETLVIEANRDPSLRLAAGIARLADARLPPGGRLAVAGPPVPAAAIADYVRKVRRARGDVARAEAIGRSLAAHSADADRVAAHLPRPPKTVILAGSAPADLVAVYDDAPDPSRWKAQTVLARLVEGGRSVTLYRAERGAPRR